MNKYFVTLLLLKQDNCNTTKTIMKHYLYSFIISAPDEQKAIEYAKQNNEIQNLINNESWTLENEIAITDIEL